LERSEGFEGNRRWPEGLTLNKWPDWLARGAEGLL
jgi:hypothetical protein